jgi:hypothetical protein
MIANRPDIIKRFSVLLPVSPRKTDIYAILADISAQYHLFKIISSPRYRLEIDHMKGNHLELSIQSDYLNAKLISFSLAVDKQMKIPLNSHDVAMMIHQVVQKFGVDLDPFSIESKIKPIVTNSLLNHLHIEKLARLIVIDYILGTNDAVSSYLKN